MAHRLVLGTLLGVFAPTALFAQTATIPEGVGVADRARPDYQPIGGRMGSFFLYPKAELDVDATDNVRATTDDRLNDVYFVLSGSAKLQSNFSRHGLNVQVFGNRSFHTQATSENVSDYGGQLDGHYDISGDTTVSAYVRAEHSFESRDSYNSPLGALAPSQYSQVSTALTGQQTLGRFDLAATFAFRSTRFDDVPLDTGGVLDQLYRDANFYSGSLMLGYRVRPGMSVIMRATVDKLDYTLSPNDPRQPLNLDRDSKGLRVEGGFRFDLTSLLYGEVRIGYFKRNYADPRLVDTAGLSFGADLLWNVTPMTSIRLSADRRVDEAASTTIAGNRTTVFELSADHELKRNLILSADGKYEKIQPLGPLGASNEFYAGAGAKLLLSRQLSFRAHYQYAKRTSPVIGRPYDENLGMLSAVLTL